MKPSSSEYIVGIVAGATIHICGLIIIFSSLFKERDPIDIFAGIAMVVIGAIWLLILPKEKDNV